MRRFLWQAPDLPSGNFIIQTRPMVTEDLEIDVARCPTCRRDVACVYGEYDGAGPELRVQSVIYEHILRPEEKYDDHVVQRAALRKAGISSGD